MDFGSGIEVGTRISFFVAMTRTTNKTVARNGHRNNDRNNDPNIVWLIFLACDFVKIFSSARRGIEPRLSAKGAGQMLVK